MDWATWLATSLFWSSSRDSEVTDNMRNAATATTTRSVSPMCRASASVSALHAPVRTRIATLLEFEAKARMTAQPAFWTGRDDQKSFMARKILNTKTSLSVVVSWNDSDMTSSANT